MRICMRYGVGECDVSCSTWNNVYAYGEGTEKENEGWPMMEIFL